MVFLYIGVLLGQLMDRNLSYNLGGFLLDWSERNVVRTDLLKCDSLTFVRKIPNTHWEEFEYLSQIALRGEDEISTAKPYRYVLICRRSGSRIILLSFNRDIVEHLLESELSKIFVPKLRAVSIAVDELVRGITAHPTKYSLSFVHARVPAFGTALRSVSYYGDDLADASLFRDNVDLMNFFICGLRPTVGKSEIVRVGTDGTLSFYMPNVARLNEVEEVFSFLRKEGYFSIDILNSTTAPE